MTIDFTEEAYWIATKENTNPAWGFNIAPSKLITGKTDFEKIQDQQEWINKLLALGVSQEAIDEYLDNYGSN
jgi:hypothetical protein